MNAGKNVMSKIKETELARKIKELRSTLGLTQEQFAAKVGVTFSTVNRWENGKGKPSPLAMRQIEELMDQAGDSQ
jgi:putative transcriptional regulator